MKKRIAQILTWQAKRYLKKNKPKVVAITGSVGKTSTTQAIGTVLSQGLRVRVTLHNYNSDIGVPCSIFNQQIPSRLKNPVAWVWVLVKNEFKLLKKASFELLVLELGTDNPGEIAEFSWLKPDVAVITAVAPEHMEKFVTIEAVAKEEMAVADYSDKVLLNKDSVGHEFLQFMHNQEVYNYQLSDLDSLSFKPEELSVVGEHSLQAVCAAIAVGKQFGLSDDQLRRGVQAIQPVKGRMSKLSGVKNSVLIDDTYNSSPEAVFAALDYIKTQDSPQKIALLGNMNELGESSKDSHEEVGRYCKEIGLDLVVTLGPDANEFTAPAATDAGCLVMQTRTPYEAAEVIEREMREGALVLLKGTHNKVFAEEAVKLLLADTADLDRIVRQSPFWMKKKNDCFKEN